MRQVSGTQPHSFGLLALRQVQVAFSPQTLVVALGSHGMVQK